MSSTLAKQPKTHNPLDIETFEIKPTKMHKAILGRFSRNDPMPEFRVRYHVHDIENPNVVTYHDSAVSHTDGTFTIYRNFQSYSQLTHVITVRFASAADKALSK
ncbi:hypothetical protein ACIRSS_50105 [Amycolatopsis sp. NPDC101161]|uniref:hypothetical protein n=1 Tax=Amycolatopsis sp. NPDC101161 TaxID=3363940 RepID=UPI0037F11ACF